MSHVRVRLAHLWEDQSGASLGEYAFLVSLIAVVCVGAVTAAGLTLKSKFNELTKLAGGTPAP